jgi:hypothetical protein
LADYTAKKGDLLSDLEVQLVDRKRVPMDLTNASSVLVYLRAYGATTNELNGVSCAIQTPKTEGRILGPAEVLDTTGIYMAYFKVLYGDVSKRVPSEGLLYINVEDNFE